VSEAPTVLGAIIAGGRSARYGSPKAIASVGGTRIIDRVHAALATITPDIIMIANAPVIAQAIDIPTRADALPSLGAIAGVHAALVWASELGRDGIVAVACDMPFLSVDLLRELMRVASGADGPDIAVPESDGPRGFEPLCAFYRTTCIGPIEAAAARDDHRMIGFHDDVRVARVPIDRVRACGSPEVLFMNVNTPEDRAAAERIAAGAAGG
jgi:molybdopterin-guanine dinucleotide biosynthesis protein A